ncbi:PqqD family peptide modification chaperone [Microbacterium sp.]|uniref:PqqD family peptide modification chaperone n=1 Tax=Microbacterium sp. TaxID=51671 RepID=UPI002FE2983B
MPDRFLVSAVGAVIEIDVSRRDPSFRNRVHAAWADAVYEGDRSVDATATDRPELDDDAALAMLSTDVTLLALAERKGDALWMLHAAGLADERGNVVVLSAPSGTGKTTAARHLSRRYAYISDETIGIDEHGGVIPYRKPLSVIQPDRMHKEQLALSSLDGGRPVPDALRIAKIVVLDRADDGPDMPEVEQLDLVSALELLAPQTSYLGDAVAPLRTIDAILAATGGAVRVHYREVSTIDDVIAELLRTEVSAIEVHGIDAVDREEPTAEPATGVFSRAEVVDELEIADGRVAVLQRSVEGTTLRVLDGIGPAIWAAAASGRTLDEIVAAVIAEHGAPEGIDAAATVDAAVRHLVGDGLLTPAVAQA